MMVRTVSSTFFLILLCGAIAPSYASEYRRLPLHSVTERTPDGAPALSGQRVTVTGVANVRPDVFSKNYSLFFIQDGEAGVAVFTTDLSLPKIDEGTRVEVSGVLTSYNGLIQIRAVSIRVVGKEHPPRPLLVEGHELRAQSLQGRLVEVRGIVAKTFARSGQQITLLGSDDTLTDIYITADQRGDGWEAVFREGDLVAVTGIAAQFDRQPPFQSGWQVRPRAARDVVVLPASFLERDDLVMIGAIAGAALAASLGWIVALRRRVRYATRSLRQTIDLLRAQQEATADGLLVADATGRVTHANERFLQMWKVTRDDLRDTTVAELFARLRSTLIRPDDLRFSVKRTSAPAALPDLRLTDGRIVAVTTAQLPPADGGAVWTFRDMTEREALRDQVTRNQHVARLGQLAASISHEFNNVLMAIQPQAELIKRTAPLATGAADRILTAVRRGKRTTTEVLSLVRPVEIVLEDVSVNAFIADVSSEIKSYAANGIDVVIEPAADDLYMRAGHAELAQVMINLARNAIQAMPDGGGLTMRARPNERTAYSFGNIPAGRDYIHFEVADTGGGIAPDVIDHIFEPFFSTKKRVGTGLGLAIAHQIVTGHNGYIFAESGERTTFHLFIPAGAAPERRMENESDAQSAISGICVLVVEDDEAVAEGLETVLTQAGVKVVVISNGSDAIAAVDTLLPNAIVLDLDLPDMSGERVYEEISARYADLPVVFSSGHIGTTDLQRSLKGRRVAFLEKPYETRDLLGTITRFFDVGDAA